MRTWLDPAPWRDRTRLYRPKRLREFPRDPSVEPSWPPDNSFFEPLPPTPIAFPPGRNGLAHELRCHSCGDVAIRCRFEMCRCRMRTSFPVAAKTGADRL